MSQPERRLVAWFLYVAMLALSIGATLGPFQALEHAGINLYPYLAPFIRSYYQGLSIHGVFNVLVWTTFFISGFLTFATMSGLKHPLYSLKLGWITFWIMIAGIGLTGWALFSDNATVMFTSYPPLKAHPAYYLGLTLVVVGTWLVSANIFLTYRAWRRDHPTERTPLATFGALATFVMWDIASLGIAAEFLTLLIPASFGITQGTDPLLARAFFWFTGHPIVYFWLLPAYVSWYAMVPKQAGGKLFSDPLARLALVLFIPFSIPVGLHHQFTDPGISEAWKMVHAALTFVVFFPSALTAFTLLASLENAGRARGGRGWFGWFFKLRWDDPAVAAQVLAMLLFAAGGVSGIINASYDLNLMVHNTAWVPGHFHLTVGSGVTLTFMGISYWLIPYLTGRKLWSRRVALWQAWTWFAGMLLLGRGLHWLGLLGAPRRTMLGAAAYRALNPEWGLPSLLVGVGGGILAVSLYLYLVEMAATIWFSREPADIEVPEAEAVSGPEHAPFLLERWRVWIGAAVVLTAIGYVPTVVQLLAHFNPVASLRVW
ncbi:cbb3-type cytochrome c oxidase subunit I [Carboxydochorda subterranea]|uniref:Cbb3-type cytochrome c oxidase subunit I n=1 Tax=Carboxydichorda subterranea TaxID=3109565 RepID=A0ABZ1BV28_9FIRM|nr:cbb3-type cytochrome c oxidase subunit I [Limnochorda sp. L945t]WRP16661.1 cbb3-type cytochrome c oxidase subunit I [Limnochorda sp. L945t]